MGEPSGIGVLDKAVGLLTAAAAEPATLAELVGRTGLPRATTHRLAVALEVHGLLARDRFGRFGPGPALVDLARGAADPLVGAAGPVLSGLSAETGESAQLYRREGEVRVCVAAVERASGLRDTVPVGARLPMTAGSAAQVLAAWAGRDDSALLPDGAVYTARALGVVRRRGWAASVGEREPGVASVSAPVRDPAGAVVAAVSVSGPAERVGGRYAAPLSVAVLAAAADLTAAAG